ncbi:ArdC-like ssDNA-binding domain-containing protein [Actinomycetaceae bacterium MB13-C1-2]|nr:ArdC-like ssDNA-binding domain-containing protein [Actinomycetaceae bacterium MB13-C1-2]
MATKEEARAAREAKLEELHDKLTGAVEQLVTGEDWIRALTFAAKFRTRSFNNTLLIWAQHMQAYEEGKVDQPFPTYVAGYRQWQGLDRQVVKGQSGYMIFAPVTARFASANPVDPLSWRRLAPGEKRKVNEVERSRMVGAKPAYVWDVSQTDGTPIPETPKPALFEGQAPAGLWDGLAAQVKAAGFTLTLVADESEIHGANGVTDYASKTVTVRSNMSDAAQVKTLAHELGHVLMHGPDNPDTMQHRGISEVEAESVVLMIGAVHGMDTSIYTVPYVSGWASSVEDTSPAEVVKATGERVRKIATGILDQLDTMKVGDGNPPGLNRDAIQNRNPQRSVTAPSAVESQPLRSAEPVLVGRGLS